MQRHENKCEVLTLKLEGFSSKHLPDGRAEENSATGRKFRMRCGDFFRIQLIESTTDNFPEREPIVLYSPDRFTAPKDGHLRGCKPELKSKISMDVIYYDRS